MLVGERLFEPLAIRAIDRVAILPLLSVHVRVAILPLLFVRIRVAIVPLLFVHVLTKLTLLRRS